MGEAYSFAHSLCLIVVVRFMNGFRMNIRRCLTYFVCNRLLLNLVKQYPDVGLYLMCNLSTLP